MLATDEQESRSHNIVSWMPVKEYKLFNSADSLLFSSSTTLANSDGDGGPGSRLGGGGLEAGVRDSLGTSTVAVGTSALADEVAAAAGDVIGLLSSLDQRQCTCTYEDDSGCTCLSGFTWVGFLPLAFTSVFISASSLVAWPATLSRGLNGVLLRVP